MTEFSPEAQTAAAAPKKTKRQLQAEETKKKIYNTAVQVINEKGFNNVNIEDITTAANVAKGSFYTHFESKEALVFFTYQRSDEVYEQAYRQIDELDFLSMVTSFVRISYREYEQRGKGIIKAMITNYFAQPGHNFYNNDRPLLQCLSKIVTRGKEEQLLDPSVSNERYVSILLSTMIGIEVLWCFDEEDRSLADMMEEAIRTTAKGMMR